MSELETLLGVTPFVLVMLVLSSALAGFIRGLTGFGLALIFVPLANLIIAPEQTVLLAILIAALGGGIGYRAAWKNADRSKLVRLVGASVVAVPLGLYALFSTPETIAKLLITGIAVASFAVLAARRPSQLPKGDVALYVTGLLSGFLGAFAAIPGPPIIHYFVRDGVPAAYSRDMMIVYFFWGPLIVAVAALASGRVSLQLVLLSLVCLPALMAGNAVGARFFGALAEAQWRWLVLGVIGFAAAGAVIQVI